MRDLQRLCTVRAFDRIDVLDLTAKMPDLTLSSQ